MEKGLYSVEIGATKGQGEPIRYKTVGRNLSKREAAKMAVAATGGKYTPIEKFGHIYRVIPRTR
jgi:hypothetical protein